MIGSDPGVGQGRADRGGVAGMRVDHHRLNPGPELCAAGAQPRLHRGAGPAIDLSQQGLITSRVAGRAVGAAAHTLDTRDPRPDKRGSSRASLESTVELRLGEKRARVFRISFARRSSAFSLRGRASSAESATEPASCAPAGLAARSSASIPSSVSSPD
ncbi:MAG: hypothetical protein V7646_5538 [Pseudonocardia sp.]